MKASLAVKVHVAWWVRPYLAGCEAFARTFGMQPDFAKIASTLARGLIIKVRWK